jgi:heat shock protein HslJ
MRSTILAFAAAALAACAPAADTQSALTGDWVVQEIAGASLNAEARIHFSIDAAAGTISGSTGCNSFNGVVTQFEQTVAISNVTATERACLEEAATVNEQRFLGVLPSVTRFARNGARLELLGPPGQADALILARHDDGATPTQ